MGFWAPLAVAAVSGMMSSKMGGTGDGGAGSTMSEAVSMLKNLRAPTAEELTYKLEGLVQQGVITPEQARTFLMDRTAYEDVSVDPRLRAAQMDALSSLQEIGDAGGLTATDRAKIEAMSSRVGQEARGAREAILQHQAERGRSGSGFELAAQLQNAQDAATRASQEGTDIAALAEQRALEAITQGGTLAGQMRGQEFGEQAQVAEAQDALQRFNLEHLRGTDAANVDRRNAANAANLAETQRISDANATIKGENRAIAANARQTAYENDLDRRRAVSDALAARAQQQTERQKQKATAAGSMMGAGATVAAGMLSKSDERSKDVAGDTPDMDAFMEALKPLAFTYKDPASPGAAEGENVGVVAQDVEKTPVGRTMVKNTPDGKMLDIQKGFGVILAALAALHDKIEAKEGQEEPAHA